jgi:hypothetical protein
MAFVRLGITVAVVALSGFPIVKRYHGLLAGLMCQQHKIIRAGDFRLCRAQ